MSKTCVNSLNFIKEDFELSLLQKDQPQVVLDIFSIFYVLINEDYKSLEGNNLLSNLFDNLYKKYNVDSISKYYLIVKYNFLYVLCFII